MRPSPDTSNRYCGYRNLPVPRQGPGGQVTRARDKGQGLEAQRRGQRPRAKGWKPRAEGEKPRLPAILAWQDKQTRWLAAKKPLQLKGLIKKQAVCTQAVSGSAPLRQPVGHVTLEMPAKAVNRIIAAQCATGAALHTVEQCLEALKALTCPNDGNARYFA